ncbi:MAG: serine protease [Pseudobacteriovorax sp.]|nr:serine protease [Pseudobacteriovorax sp.]
MKNLVKATAGLLTGWLIMTGCGSTGQQETSTLDIVGGQTVSDGLYDRYFQSIASLQIRGQHFCGGTLIDESTILTAAHCLVDLGDLASELRIVLGTNDLNERAPETFSAASINVDSRFSNATNQYDIALITLNGTSNITPAPVNLDSSFPSASSTVYVAGWGAQREGGRGSDLLKYTGVEVVSNAECAQAYGSNIFSGNICAYTPQTDSCQGDSGGPLYSYDGEKLTVVGVVSWGFGCARRGYPGVYTRVSEFL